MRRESLVPRPRERQIRCAGASRPQDSEIATAHQAPTAHRPYNSDFPLGSRSTAAQSRNAEPASHAKRSMPWRGCATSRRDWLATAPVFDGICALPRRRSLLPFVAESVAMARASLPGKARHAGCCSGSTTGQRAMRWQRVQRALMLASDLSTATRRLRQSATADHRWPEHTLRDALERTLLHRAIDICVCRS